MIGKPPRPSLVAPLWLVLGLILGLLLARVFKNESPKQIEFTHEAQPAVPPPATVVSHAPPASVSTPDPPKGDSALQKLRRLAANETSPDVAACLGLIQELSLNDCRISMELFRRWPREERHVVQRALARRWAGLDPDDALRALSRTRDTELGNLLGAEVARELIKRDPETALAKISSSGGSKPHLLLVHYAMTALAEKDPARAAAFLLTRLEYLRDENVFGTVSAHWAKTDPVAALAWATALPNGSARQEALKTLWTTWAERDPTTVVSAIRSSPATRFDPQVFGAIARSWSRGDPTAASAWIESISRKEDRDAAWSGFDLDARQLGTDRALAVLKTISSEQHRADLAGRVASALAREDPQAALAWAERLPEGPERNQALRPALDEWAAKDPGRAVGYVAGLPAGNSRTELLRRAVASWATQDMDAAFQWSSSLPAGNERDEVLAEAARGLREHVDPARAGQWLELMESPAKRQDLVQELARDWGRVNGPAAADWLRQLPDAESQVQGHHQLARQWAFVDRDGTARWLDALPSGRARDAAIGAFVQTVDGYDPGLATAWAGAIEQPSERERYIRSAFDRWLQRDIPAAQDWIAGVEMSESLRHDLLRASEEQQRRQAANSK